MLPGWLLALILLALVGAVTACRVFFTSRSMKDESELVMRKGLLADAEIISYNADSDCFWVTYRFTPRGETNSIICKKAIARVRKSMRFAPGTLVPVRYLPKYPSISLLVPYAKHQIPSS